MIRSMTAFADYNDDGLGLSWQIRSVNQRFLELRFELPDDLRRWEMALRRQIGQQLKRGKVDIRLQRMSDQTAATLQVNQPLWQQLSDCYQQMAQQPANEQVVAQLMSWPQLLQTTANQPAPSLDQLSASLALVLERHVAQRQQEGAALADFVSQRLSAIGQHLDPIRQQRPQVLARLRAKFQQRLADLELASDPQRLELEMALHAQKLDIDEELDRLATHLDTMAEHLQRSTPVGRGLDFLSQELNREANTLAAKAADTATVNHALAIKVLIEQIREQIQNIE